MMKTIDTLEEVLEKFETLARELEGMEVFDQRILKLQTIFLEFHEALDKFNKIQAATLTTTKEAANDLEQVTSNSRHLEKSLVEKLTKIVVAVRGDVKNAYEASLSNTEAIQEATTTMKFGFNQNIESLRDELRSMKKMLVKGQKERWIALFVLAAILVGIYFFLK